MHFSDITRLFICMMAALLSISSNAASVMPVAIVTNVTSDILTSSVPTRIVIDPSNRTCIAGQGLDGRLTTAMFAQDGIRLWVTSYAETTNAPNDRPVGIAVDASNAVYVVAASKGDGTKEDYLTVKFDAAGVLQWSRRFNGASNDNDTPIAIALHSNGVYVTGHSFVQALQGRHGSINQTELRTLKYADDGTLLWSTNFSGDFRSQAQCLKVDSLGNPIVAGITFSGPFLDTPDIRLKVIKYSAQSGDLLWSQSVGSGSVLAIRAGTMDPPLAAMTLDSDDTVYVTTLRSDSKYFIPIVCKLGPAGWSQDIPLLFSFGQSYGITLNNTNLVVSGRWEGKNFVGSYRKSNGASNWLSSWIAPNDFRPGGDSLYVNDRGDVYLSTSWQYSQLVTLKYLSDGSLAWESSLPVNFANSQILRLDPNGHVIVSAQANLDSSVEHITWRFLPAAPPINRRSDGVVFLNFRVDPFATNRVQHSTSLTNWQDFGMAVSDAEGALSFIDSNAVNFPMRFYRAAP